MAKKPKTRQRCFFSTYLEHTQNGSGGEEISRVVFGSAKTAFRESQETCLEKQLYLFGQFCCKSCNWGEAALVMHQERILTCHCTYKARTLFDPESTSLGRDCRLFRLNHLKATKRVCSWYRQSLLSMTRKSPRQTYLNKKKNRHTCAARERGEITTQMTISLATPLLFTLLALFSKYVCPTLFLKYPEEKEKKGKVMYKSCGLCAIFQLFGAASFSSSAAFFLAWHICKVPTLQNPWRGLVHEKWKWNLTLRLFQIYFKCKLTFCMR